MPRMALWQDREMSLWEHLGELRKRLFICLGAATVTFFVALWQQDRILGFLVKPLQGHKLVFLSPAGGLVAVFKVAAYVGLLAAAPIWLYQIWSFVAPALKQRERKWVLTLTVVSLVLFVIGVMTSWILLPFMMGIMLEPSPYMQSMITANDYFSFLLWLALAFGITYQMPIVVVFLVRMRLITVRTLWRGQRWAILIAFIAAAIITPTPDIVNQTIFALPILALYEVSLIAAWFVRPRDLPAPVVESPSL